jgi:hypothetical protein
VRFKERREWAYDPEVFKISDTQTALKIHDEYVRKHSGNRHPEFLEVNRDAGQYDPLWHMPINPRTPISRKLTIPAIITSIKPTWLQKREGVVPQRRDQMWVSNLGLQAVDWFPMRGDMAYWNGYRYFIYEVVIPTEVYWQQTNVWLGLRLDCIIPPEGDARPLLNPGEVAPAESQAPYGL